jgi:predicted phosphohydrolase
MLPPGDILIHCGDFMCAGWSVDEVLDFNRWMGEQPFTHRVVVAGNHDMLFEAHPGFVCGVVTNFHYLQDSGITLAGLRIWGSPRTPTFLNWAFMADRGPAIRRYWDGIPKHTDVLITHGPPKLIRDQITPGSEHLGCEELSFAVDRVNPRVHLFGHIHGGHGQYWNGKTTFVNCAVMDETYKVVHPATVIDVPVEQGFEHLLDREWRNL